MSDASHLYAPRRPAIDFVLNLVLDRGARDTAQARGRTTSGPAGRRLARLFAELALPRPARPPAEIEDLIWALWISHPDPAAEDAMADAVNALAAGDFDVARPILDSLVERCPDWAEAWNKRSTLAYMEDRDADSVAGIRETLKREPRHFGAIAGFGMICARHGYLCEARAAFAVALSLNPHLDGIRMQLAEMEAIPSVLH